MAALRRAPRLSGLPAFRTRSAVQQTSSRAGCGIHPGLHRHAQRPPDDQAVQRTFRQLPRPANPRPQRQRHRRPHRRQPRLRDEPRIERSKTHELLDILIISVAATLAGADGPSDVADFTRQQLAWRRRFVPLENDPPSHDTIGRALSLIKPEQFQIALLDWIASFTETSFTHTSPAGAATPGDGPRFTPIDGKTLRGST